jgi:hypothetical protein
MTSKRGDTRVLTQGGLIICICTSFKVKGMTTLLELKVHYVNTWRNNVKSMPIRAWKSSQFFWKISQNLRQMHNNHHNHSKDVSKKEMSWEWQS